MKILAWLILFIGLETITGAIWGFIFNNFVESMKQNIEKYIASGFKLGFYEAVISLTIAAMINGKLDMSLKVKNSGEEQIFAPVLLIGGFMLKQLPVHLYDDKRLRIFYYFILTLVGIYIIATKYVTI
jgi:hypothetical protein